MDDDCRTRLAERCPGLGFRYAFDRRHRGGVRGADRRPGPVLRHLRRDRDGEEAAANIAKRMAAVPRAYRQLSATLLDAARDGRSAARRQVEDVVGQCAAWAKPGDSFYSGLVGRLAAVPDSLRAD